MSRICLWHGKTSVYLNSASILFAAYLCLIGQFRMLVAAGGSILLHEAVHAAVARLLGYTPDEIELSPFGAMLTMNQFTKAPVGKRVLMLLAGPAATFMLCLTAIRAASAGWLPYAWCRLVFACNAAILMMNLLPCLPLDGGGIVAALLSLRFPMSTVNRVMRTLGRIIGAVLIVLAFVTAWQGNGLNISLVISGCFLLYAAHAATAAAVLQVLTALTDRHTRLYQQKMMPASIMAVMSGMQIESAARRLPQRRYTTLIVIDEATMRRIGTCGEEELVAALMRDSSLTVGRLLRDTGKC